MTVLKYMKHFVENDFQKYEPNYYEKAQFIPNFRTNDSNLL